LVSSFTPLLLGCANLQSFIGLLPSDQVRRNFLKNKPN